MNKLLTYFYCASLLCCVEVNAMENSPISSVPNPLMRHILSSFLSEDERENLRSVSKGMKKNVEDIYKAKLKTHFGNYTLLGKAFPLKDLLTDSPGPFPAPFESHYTNRIMKEVCTEYIKGDGYLFVAQGSLLEGYLGQHYKSVPLYDYLKDQVQNTKDLFKAFFGRDLPDSKYDLGLKLLTACLPSNHIYVNKETPKEKYSELMAKFQSRLLKSIQGHKTKYFLCRIDEPSTLSDKDVIVINQSDVDQDFISHLDKSSVRRTIIYNADQEELFFSNPPKCMSNLILVNGDNRCASIGDNFLTKNQNLQSCTLKGLTSVHTIGDRFLFGCDNLVTFDTKGMTNVQTIGNFFLFVCGNLVTFDSSGMTNIQTIGNEFLYGCSNLVTFDTNRMTSVQTIGAFFLSGCENLKTFDSKGMRSVHTIGHSFLYCCEKLVDFDTKGLKNVQTIEDNFLNGCPKLNGNKIKEEILKKKF